MDRALNIIEFMVVVIIIAVVGGLSVYAISNAIESARTVTCQKNISQQGMAYLQYIDANPINGTTDLTGFAMPKVQDHEQTPWTEKLAEYVESDEIFVCPSAAIENQPSYGMNPLAAAGWSYEKNEFTGAVLLPGETRQCNFLLLKNPAATVLINDTAKISVQSTINSPENWREVYGAWKPYTAFSLSSSRQEPEGKKLDYGYNWGNTAASGLLGEMIWDQYRRAFARHPANMCSSLFADGHANTLEISSLIEPEWGAAECLYDNQ